MRKAIRVMCAAIVVILCASLFGAVTSGGLSVGPFGLLEVATSSPIDGQYQPICASATSATTSPYQPGTVTLRVPMGKFSGFAIIAEYNRAETLTTDPVGLAWGVLSDGTHVQLKDSNGSIAMTIADAATDCDDGVTYKRTAPTAQIDALGCPEVKVTVSTAAVSSASGAVRLKIKRF